MNTIKYLRPLLMIHLMVMGAVLGCAKYATVDIHPLAALEAKAVIEKQVGNPDFVILDVRTPKEFKQGHIARAIMLDYHSAGFITGLQKLDKSKTYLIYCRTGNRSGRTLKMIEKMDFQTIYHLKHGIVDWQAQKLPLVKS